MDLKKIKALTALVKEAGLLELEITEGEEKLKITAFDRNANYNIGHIPTAHYHVPAAPSINAIAHHQHSIATDTATVNNEATPSTNMNNYINSPMVVLFIVHPHQLLAHLSKLGRKSKLELYYVLLKP